MRANQLSKTAAFIAVKFYGLTRIDKFRALFDDSVVSFYDRVVKFLPAPIRYYHFWLTYSWIRKLYIWSEELLLPGDLLHVVARKWYIQQMVDQLMNQGYQQLIVLGAGFDHLATHYSAVGLSCYEFDTPYMTNIKERFLKKYYNQNSRPEIVSSYLSNDNFEKLLLQHEIDPHKKTIIIAEGFYDYLSPTAVDASLGQIRNYFSQSPALISTHFALDELSPFHRMVFKKSVRFVGEELLFHTSLADFKKILTHKEFNIKQLYDSHQIEAELHSRIDTHLRLLDGFYILRAC